MELPPIEDLVPRTFNESDNKKIILIKQVLKELFAVSPKLVTKTAVQGYIKKKEKSLKTNFPLTHLLYIYRLDHSLHSEIGDYYTQFFKTKEQRENSGVNVITIFTTGYPEGERFDCKFDCWFCPDKKGHPRSYDPNEPGVMRAIQCNYDPVLQFYTRAETYITNGLSTDKAEVLVLGGTWSGYPDSYQENFIRDSYFAANTLYNNRGRERLDLDTEIKLNEKAKCRIIGLTLETRPDMISTSELIRFRRFGVTRVQLGLQHTNDDILRYVNRRHLLRHAKNALQMLKDNGFKVDIHLMPDLPSSSPEEDLRMFETVLYDPDLQADQWKAYPTSVLDDTKIKIWYDNENRNYDTINNPEGLAPEDNRRYKPYQEIPLPDKIKFGKRDINSTPLLQLLIQVLPKVHPWIRINRVIRDFPKASATGETVVYNTTYIANTRQILDNIFKERDIRLWDIRSREVKNKDVNPKDIIVVIRKFKSVGGSTEYFISFEDNIQSTIYAFLRLYFPNPDSNKIIFNELQGCALIRELHTYGKVAPVGTSGSNSQHIGFGWRLLRIAESIALSNGYQKISVIAGVGVRDYYRKRGYFDRHGQGNFQIKDLKNAAQFTLIPILCNNTKILTHLNYEEYIILNPLELSNNYSVIIWLLFTTALLLSIIVKIYIKI